MSATEKELDRFRRFAAERIRAGADDLTIEGLLKEWRLLQVREAADAAIRQSCRDIEAGNFRSLDEFIGEFRREHKLDGEA